MQTNAVRAGRAYVEFYADASRLNASLKNALGSLESFGERSAGISKSLIAVGASLVAPLQSSIKEFAGFDDQLRIAKAVSGASAEQFRELKERAEELGRTTTFTSEQVASAMVSLGRSGFSTDQILDSIASVMNLSRATATDVPAATDIASNALRAFGLETTEMSRVCDVLTATANGSAQTLDDLGEALKYVAPIAAQTGMTLEDTAKIVGALANFGIKGSMAGTAFKNIQTRMVDPSTQKKYADLGVSTVDDDGYLRNIADVIRDIAAATSQLPNAEKLAIFQDLFGMYGLAGGAALSAGADFKELFDAIDAANGRKIHFRPSATERPILTLRV